MIRFFLQFAQDDEGFLQATLATAAAHRTLLAATQPDSDPTWREYKSRERCAVSYTAEACHLVNKALGDKNAIALSDALLVAVTQLSATEVSRFLHLNEVRGFAGENTFLTHLFAKE